MRPESFPTDDSLARSVQPASAPLSAKEGAFGEENAPYEAIFGDVSKIIDAARDSAARSVNAAMTAAYWLIGRRIDEFEQSLEERAEYGAALIERLAEDLTGRFDRGFSRQNVQNMRLFYLSYPIEKIRQTLSGKLPASPRWRIRQTPSGISEAASIELGFDDLLVAFPLPWSAYVRLLSVRNESAREFYETEALRGGWSVRQLDRQIGSQFYERTALSKNRASMLTGGLMERSEDHVVPGEQIKDPSSWSSSTSRTSTPRATWRRPSSATWRPSSWSWETTSASSAGRGGCASAASGTGLTCCSFTAV